MTRPGSDGELKAELISVGRVAVPKGLLAGYRLSRSTAGPGAGRASLAIGWTGADGLDHQVKLSLAREGDADAPLQLHQSSGDDRIVLKRRDGTTLLEDVRLIPIVMHAPGQAFINLDGECIYECAFCTTHLMDARRKNLRTPERWIELVLEAYSQQPFPALSITSVAAPDHEGMMRAYETIIVGVLERLPGMAVGVEPYVRGPEDIARLRRAGAIEIKINVQSPVQEILGRICPGWSLARQYELLDEAVQVFGRGKVTTNIIVGLGETDVDVRDAVERLASMGVVPSVRAVRLNELNRPNLERALGHPVSPVSPERHLALARMLHQVLTEHGLTAGSLETMCHKCGCCDLEPGRDV